MSNATKLGRGKPLQAQSKEILMNIYSFMRDELERNKRPEDLGLLLKRTSQAAGVSEKSVDRVLKEKKNFTNDQCPTMQVYSSPKKKRAKKEDAQLDDCDKSVIRRCVHNFHIVQKQLPTLKRIHNALKQDFNYNGSVTKLWRTLKLLGFTWKKMEDNRKLLVEKHEIRYKRLTFLQKIKEFREQGRPIIYTDDTYIHSTHATTLSWTDGTTKALKKPTTKTSRIIIVHAGGAQGFIPNALLIHKSLQKQGDSNNEISYENYEKWVEIQLLPNLPPNSVVVLDNSSYHNEILDPAPMSNSKRQVMVDWLQARNIDFSYNLLKPQLYHLICLHKVSYTQYRIDKVFNRYGHTVLRLPPHHPEFKPIENIWSLLKGYVAQNNVEMTLDVVTRLVKEKIHQISYDPQVWALACHQVEENEKHFRDIEPTLDNVSEMIVSQEDSSNGESDGDISGMESDDDE